MRATTRAGEATFATGGGFDFPFLESLAAVLLLGLLTGVSVPLLSGYVKEVKTVPAKSVAWSLWRAVHGRVVTNCDVPARVSDGYAEAGLGTSGQSVHWSVGAGSANVVTLDCRTGTTGPDQDVFTIVGITRDVDFIRVKLRYTAAASPPTRLLCSVDSGRSFQDC